MKCLICGTTDDLTREDIFPKWLQKRFELSAFPNATASNIEEFGIQNTPYQNLLVPWCATCNNETFSKIENQVSKAYKEGFEAVSGLDSKIYFLWLLKIYIGLMHIDRRPNGRKVRIPNFLGLVDSLGQEHAFLESLLQAAIGRLAWPEIFGIPATLYFFRTQVDQQDSKVNFDYVDNNIFPMLGIRIGEVGTVAIFEEWGRKALNLDAMETKYRSIALHPTQFRQVVARILCGNAATKNTKSYLTLKSEDLLTIIPASAQSSEESDSEVLALYPNFLAFYLNTSLDNIHDENGTLNFIDGPDGKLLEFEWPQELRGKRSAVFPYVDSLPE